MATTQTPAARRFAAIAKIANEVTDATTAAQFATLADSMAQLSTLGRTDRWKKACAFAADEIDAAAEAGNLTREHARWAVLQGSVWMGYAAE